MLGSGSNPARRLTPVAALVAALACALAFATQGSASVEKLQSKVDGAKAQAEQLASELASSKTEMFAAQQRAAAAAAREDQLTGLLTTGQARAAKLSGRVDRSQRRLEAEKARLGRARDALASRLVAIYESGEPNAADEVLAGGSFSDIAVRAGYVSSIQEADESLADRVEQVRDGVHRTVVATTKLRDAARAYNARIADARDQIASARASAESEAANLASITADRSAQIDGLQSEINGWVGDIAAQKAAAAKRAAASAADEAAAEEQVDQYFGGPYAIPTYIVMCESGGNYSAVNPSSGAGGAYQILPSTWEAYGGEGLPQNATKGEQDQIAAEIYADSGASPWVCG